MTCEECLKELAVVSTREIERSEAWRHSNTCSDCARIVRVLTESEDELATTLDATTSQVPADFTVRRAIALAHRRKVASRLSILFAVAAVIALWVTIGRGLFWAATGGANLPPLETASIEIRCLKNEQARDLISPYIESRRGSVTIASTELSVLTVKGTPGELRKVNEVLRRFDVAPAEKCPLPSRTRLLPN